MPSLTPEARKALLGPLGDACQSCKGIRVRHYCRSCDEFFIACGCDARRTDDEKHVDHRVYLWTPDRGVVAIPDFDALSDAVVDAFLATAPPPDPARTARIRAKFDAASPSHYHGWSLHARIERAPIDDADPVAHTSFMLLSCDCGAVTAFPLENYALTTSRYKADLARSLAAGGRFFDPVA